VGWGFLVMSSTAFCQLIFLFEIDTSADSITCTTFFVVMASYIMVFYIICKLIIRIMTVSSFDGSSLPSFLIVYCVFLMFCSSFLQFVIFIL